MRDTHEANDQGKIQEKHVQQRNKQQMREEKSGKTGKNAQEVQIRANIGREQGENGKVWDAQEGKSQGKIWEKYQTKE